MAVDSRLDGAEVRHTTPTGAAWFGVVIGQTDDGAHYIVEVLSVPDDVVEPFIFIEVGAIEQYLVNA